MIRRSLHSTKYVILIACCIQWTGANGADSAEFMRLDAINQYASQIVFAKTDSSRLLALQALGIAESLQQDLEKANAHHTLGLCNHVQGKLDAALAAYQQAVTLRKGSADETKVAGLLNNMASIHCNHGDYVRALTLYQEALSIKKQSGDQEGVANTLNNIGIIHFENDDFSKAIDYYQQALEMRQNLGLTADAAASLGNIGLTYYEQGDFQNALKFYSDGFELLLSSKEVCRKLYLLNGMGITHFALGHLAMAQDFSQQAYDNAVNCQDPTIEATALNNLGKINSQLGKLRLAESQLTEAYEIAKTNQLLEELPDLSRSLYDFYRGQQWYKEALKFHEIYTQLKDSTESNEVAKKVTALELTYAFEREKDSISFAQQNEILNYTAAAERQTVIQQYTVLILILALIIAGVLFWNYRAKQKSNQVLSAKNQIISAALSEKELLVREIHHRVKNNLQIISSMLNIQRKTTADKPTQIALKESQNRVMAMSMVHKSLYAKDRINLIDAPKYIHELLDGLEDGITKHSIAVKRDIESITLAADDAINVGLIVNELFTNAVKHAFNDGTASKHIYVALKADKEQLLLTVEDNGSCMVSKPKSATSFGLNLVESIVQTMNATLAIEETDGMKIQIRIPHGA